MTLNVWLQFGIYFAVLIATVRPLGRFMAKVYRGEPTLASRALGWCERLIYRLCGLKSDAESSWKEYAVGLLLFNFVGVLAVYGLQRFQHSLPMQATFNPENLAEVGPDLSFNTAASFATNTNWQSYGGETTLSYLTQMLALSVQNFVSAACGMAVLVAMIRGLSRKSAETIGNFWVDLTRSTLYILLPMSTVLALVLVSQGVVQSFRPYRTVSLVEATVDDKNVPVTEQNIPLGPVASQEAIKQLGTNGGGFFNVNSAHPFENPNSLTNFLELLSILILAAAFCYTFGDLVGDTRQGWAVLAAMLLIFVPLLVICQSAEQAGNPRIAALGVDQTASDMQSGGNMEGKETRFGIANSTLWATATTAASNGSVNSMHDSYTPLGGLIPMWLIQLGEVIFGGVGSGLYGMLVFAIIAVFIAGLMVGRTPEYLGKKIEAFEMKMAAIVILVPPLVVLTGAAIAVLGPGLKYSATDDSGKVEMKDSLSNAGPHGFSEVLYAFSSAGNNNGSAFAGLNANNPFYNLALGISMLIARYWLMIPTLAIAGALARKKRTPTGAGTLPTHTPLFVALLAGVVMIVGALTFIPALALGPIVEHLMMLKN